jgi:hypothetical protein
MIARTSLPSPNAVTSPTLIAKGGTPHPSQPLRTGSQSGGTRSTTSDDSSSTTGPITTTVEPPTCQELYDFRPALAAARDPYCRPIHDLEHRLAGELRPALWHASHEARTAGLGHRRSAQRQAADAAQAVETAEADIAAIHTRGAPHSSISIGSESAGASFEP